MISYVIDTSALIAFLDREEGYLEVREILTDIADEKVKGYSSIVSLVEVFYIACQELGESVAHERLELIKEMRIEFCSLEEGSVYSVGRLKAQNKMSFADCCVAALALEKSATLLHKDPEFEQIDKEVKQKKLPYKKNLK